VSAEEQMPRPIILGVVGDSAAGKTTITRGLVRLLGDEHVTHIAADDYHRFDRRQRAERAITPAAPRLQPPRHHGAGPRARARGAGHPQARLPAQGRDVRPAEYVEPRQFTVVEGLLGYHTPTLRDSFDVRVFLAPPEEPAPPVEGAARLLAPRLHRATRSSRSSTVAGPTRRPTSAPSSAGRTSSSPSCRRRRRPGPPRRQVTLRDGLGHPDLSALVDADAEACA
jgi:phosphoribulokinase